MPITYGIMSLQFCLVYSSLLNGFLTAEPEDPIFKIVGNSLTGGYHAEPIVPGNYKFKGRFVVSDNETFIKVFQTGNILILE